MSSQTRWWIVLLVPVVLAAAGWTYGLTRSLSSAEHTVISTRLDGIETTLRTEISARQDGDNSLKTLIGDANSQRDRLLSELSALNKDVSALTAEMKIIIRKLP